MIEVNKGKVADTRPQRERKERLGLNGSVRLRARVLSTAKQQMAMHGYRWGGGADQAMAVAAYDTRASAERRKRDRNGVEGLRRQETL